MGVEATGLRAAAIRKSGGPVAPAPGIAGGACPGPLDAILAVRSPRVPTVLSGVSSPRLRHAIPLRRARLSATVERPTRPRRVPGGARNAPVRPCANAQRASERCRRLLTEPRVPWPPAGMLRVVATGGLLLCSVASYSGGDTGSLRATQLHSRVLDTKRAM